MWQINAIYVLKAKRYVSGKTQHFTEYHSSYFQAWWWLHHVMGMLVIAKVYGVDDQNKQNMEICTGKILAQNLVQSAFQQTLGEKFTFQQDINLKHKAKYTLVAYQDDAECSQVALKISLT